MRARRSALATVALATTLAILALPRAARPDDPAREPPPGAVIQKPDRPAAGAQAVMDDLAAEDRARFPDDASRSLRDALQDGFAPPARIFDEEPAGGLGATARAAAQGWLDSARAYGRTGNPNAGRRVLDRPGADTARMNSSGHELPEPNAAWEAQVAWFEGKLGPGGWVRRLETVVELRHGADGRVVSARLVRSSGNAAHDRAALAQAERLRGRTDLPAQRGERSRWAFETDLSIVPPVPVVGLGFDAYFRPTEVVYPLKQDVRSRVRLLSIGAPR
jgi:hypothetical protein